MRIGFIGLGRMGSGMAARLVAAGHEVTVYNRTPERCEPLRALGASVARTPRQAAMDADAVVAMLADDEASRAAWLGADGVLGAWSALDADAGPSADGVLDADPAVDADEALEAGAARRRPLAIECSTLSHAWVGELCAQVRRAGWRYVDAPVTGLPEAAASGLLTLLVGAEPDDLDAARPVLDPLAERIVHFGPPGAGTAYKLIVNMLGAVQIASAAEALALAERAGLDLGQVVATLATSQAASPQVVRTARRMAAGDADAEVTFSGRLRHKDTTYAARLASEVGARVPFADTALRGLDALLAAGRGDVNETAIIEVARRVP